MVLENGRVTPEQFAVVTGAKQGGMGFEVARQLAWKIGNSGAVFLTAHREKDAIDAAQILGDEGISVVPLVLDVTSDHSISLAVEEIRQKGGVANIFVDGAVIFPDDDRYKAATKVPIATAREIFNVNTFGYSDVVQALVPGMKEQNYGRIVHIMGSWGSPSRAGAELKGKGAAYGASKLAALYYTVATAAELVSDGYDDVLVNAVDPGKVRTNMNPTGQIDPKEAAKEIVVFATLPKSAGITGKLFRGGVEVPFDSYQGQESKDVLVFSAQEMRQV